jgi:hypothetical protein
MHSKTLIINLFGGPGCGKSTIAAGLFYKLKCDGFFDCELVTEVAKDVIWDGNTDQLANQSFVFGNQYHRIWRLLNKIDIIITDSPILLSVNYDVSKSDTFEKLVVEKFKEMNNLNFLISRTDYEQPFILNGRVNDYQSSLIKDSEILNTLDKNSINYLTISGSNSEDKTEKIYKIIKETCESDI